MIAVVGSLNMDLVVSTPNIPRPGETVMGRDFKQVPGGKGGNQAAAAAKLGGDVKMIGCVGEDDMGRVLKASLERDGVDVRTVREVSGTSTGIAAIAVGDSGDNSITVAPGANYSLTAGDIEASRGLIAEADVLLTQLEIPMQAVEKALRFAKEAGNMTILNPAPASALSVEIMKCTDILTPNETELEILSGCPADTEENIREAGRKLIFAGVGELIVTLGGSGCMHITRDGARHYPAYEVTAVDTTAAGDSFNGALAVCLDRGMSVEDAIAFAMKVGAMTVTKEGAQTSLPALAEVEAFEQWLCSQ
ncbi:ribokinase [Bacilliculturomica massiliensis]|uniref:ribokinase n=1 Tax=Bacilliculturomica massiliensis TaxID=1917867 RepID=UPI0010302FFC|nr:ribokinase [Bacilliculturomica massiliensis]